MQDTIIKALTERRAIAEFDPDKKMSEETLNILLDAGRLAPSSDGYEPWKFIVVENAELRQKIRDVGYGQPKITEAPYLVAIAYRTDADGAVKDILERNAKAQNKNIEELIALRAYYEGGMANKKAAGQVEEWFRRQTYIALGFMIETAALLNVDAGPMEGFDAEKVTEILNLKTKNLKVTSLIAFGYRKADAPRPKVRQTLDEVVIRIK